MLVGALLVIARLLRLGFVANFISTPVLTGFKAGIGLVILLDQAPKLLGVHIAKHGFFADLINLAHHIPETSLPMLAVAATTLVILVTVEVLRPHSPAPLFIVGGANLNFPDIDPACFAPSIAREIWRRDGMSTASDFKLRHYPKFKSGHPELGGTRSNVLL